MYDVLIGGVGVIGSMMARELTKCSITVHLEEL